MCVCVYLYIYVCVCVCVCVYASYMYDCTYACMLDNEENYYRARQDTWHYNNSVYTLHASYLKYRRTLLFHGNSVEANAPEGYSFYLYVCFIKEIKSVSVAEASISRTASVSIMKGFPIVLPMLFWLVFLLDDSGFESPQF